MSQGVANTRIYELIEPTLRRYSAQRTTGRYRSFVLCSVLWDWGKTCRIFDHESTPIFSERPVLWVTTQDAVRF